MNIHPIHRAACHCRAVQFEVDLPNGLEKFWRCSCSFCRMRGAIASSVPLKGLRILQGEDKLSLYQWNTKTAKHYFCSVCGIYTHHQRRSNPTEFSFNVACLEGVNPYELGEVRVIDGINHPADRPGRAGA
jgi:hypothetical protein